MKRSIVALPLVAIAIMQAGAAYADTTAAAASDVTDSTGLTDIVVTATKRETNLQQTPISMAVMGNEQIQQRHVQSLIDLADGAIPSLRVATFEARQSALTIGIRGIVPLDANQPAREQGVGVYIDGVYLGRQHGLNAGLLDVERVEVLKGPQGTLFGRNTEGGALSIVSRAPTGKFGGRMTLGAGNFGSYNGSLHMDLPEYHNVSVKVDANIQHQDATTTNPLAGQAGFNQFHRYGGRLAARWTPSSDFTADFAFDKGRDENTPFYSQLINFNPNGTATAALPPAVKVQADRARSADIGVPQQVSIDKTQGFSAILKYKLADSLELRSITAWRTVSDDQWDNSGGAHRTPVYAPNSTFSRYSLATLDQRQFSQEIQAVGSLPQIDYVLGLYYFNERANDSARTPNSNRWNVDAVNNSTGAAGADGQPDIINGLPYTIVDPATYASATIARASIAYSKSYAAYGQLTFSPEALEGVHLTVGGRYTRDEKNGSLYIVNGAATNFTFNQKNNRFDPMVTLAWDATRDINLYAKYSTGYRAGGASSRSLTYRAFAPETVKSYEIGAKTEFFDRKVRLNVAGYMMDRDNSQVDFNFFTPTVAGCTVNCTIRNTLETVNAQGTTRIRGVEADLTVRPVDNLSLGLSYAYTYTKIPPARNTVQEAQNIAANPLNNGAVFQDVYIVFTPKNALSGSVDYSLPLAGGDTAVKLHLDGNYSSSAYTFDNEAVKADASFIVNGRISIADIDMGSGGQKLTVSAWARNLFNEQHIYRRSNANRAVLGDYANFNAPRTWGIDATVNF
ncbi:TonB-dependent receptor [Sphingobium sufflavum]|uniref:TonB-dependent receptor n=1 Tax=Sphingobium sufflavum TaxID=1129547 RepID=UPI001F1F2902|nr:TonB-dependent receptor [Sphingobium sufflavum]MCE7796382.1 TonB-dependent receptor [Sphingobium sufflavum]